MPVTLILQPKCHQYWPEKMNGSSTYGNVSVTLLQEEILAEYTIRNLSLKMVLKHPVMHVLVKTVCFPLD